MKRVSLKEGKENALLRGHQWIFSGALEKIPSCQPGELLEVYSAQGNQVGVAYFNPSCSLVGRMVSYGKEDPMHALERNFQEALSLREHLFDPKETTAYRLVNGEGDRLPGLIIDRYGDACVMQIGTCGMYRLQPFFIELIKKHLPSCTTLYEKSKAQEGLKEREGFLFGSTPECVVLENGIKFHVSFPESQKTGLFLDQREMRVLVGKMAFQKRVLNCFAYSGGFSLYAAKYGAASTTTLDISKNAIAAARNNFKINNLESNFVTEDVFDFLQREALNYELVIVDPPAFIKKKGDVSAGSKGYLKLNRLVLEKMPPKSFLLTCSCSYYMDEALFQKLLMQAALLAKREVRILTPLRASLDHPIHLFHPESSYLKALFLYIT